jgi:hypothetical protein
MPSAPGTTKAASSGWNSSANRSALDDAEHDLGWVMEEQARGPGNIDEERR